MRNDIKNMNRKNDVKRETNSLCDENRNIILKEHDLMDLRIECCSICLEIIKFIINTVIIGFLSCKLYVNTIKAEFEICNWLIILLILAIYIIVVWYYDKKRELKKRRQAMKRLEVMDTKKLRTIVNDLNETLNQRYEINDNKEVLSIDSIIKQPVITFLVSSSFMLLVKMALETYEEKNAQIENTFIFLIIFLSVFLVAVFLLNLISKIFYRSNREILLWRNYVADEIYRRNAKAVKDKELKKLSWE